MGAGGRPGVRPRPAVADRALADEPDRVRPAARLGAKGGHGLIRYDVERYEPGRRVVFRFAPGSGLDGVHGSRSSRSTRTLAPHAHARLRVEWSCDPLYRVLIKAHDALVEDLLDNAERAVGGRPLPSLPLPRLVRVANAVEGGFMPARGMRLPDAAHTSRPWRIHEIAGDFRLEDVWALPTPGGPDDLAAARRDVRRRRRAGRGGRGRALRRRGRRPALVRQPRALRAALVARRGLRLGRRLARSDVARPPARRPARVTRAGPRERALHARSTSRTTSGRRRSSTGPCTR